MQSSPAWSQRRQAAASLFYHLDSNGDGRVSVEELAAALRDMRSFSDTDGASSSSSSEELSSVARKLMATAKKGSSLLCSEEETEEEDSLSLEAFLEMLNQVSCFFFFFLLLLSLFLFQRQKSLGDDEDFPRDGE